MNYFVIESAQGHTQEFAGFTIDYEKTLWTLCLGKDVECWGFSCVGFNRLLMRLQCRLVFCISS